MKVITLLKQWYKWAREEIHFIETCLNKLPDNPALLYAIAPPPEALPKFYPVLYPGVTEPADAEEYVVLVDKFRAWGEQMEDNYKAMEQIFQGSPKKDICKDVFSEWR